MRPPTREGWKRADQVAVVAWGGAIVLLTAAWTNWAAVQIPPNANPDSNVVFAVLVVPLVALTVVPGFVAGLLIHRNGPKVEALALACVGAACMVFTMSSVAAADPTRATRTPGAISPTASGRSSRFRSWSCRS